MRSLVAPEVLFVVHYKNICFHGRTMACSTGMFPFTPAAEARVNIDVIPCNVCVVPEKHTSKAWSFYSGPDITRNSSLGLEERARESLDTVACMRIGPKMGFMFLLLVASYQEAFWEGSRANSDHTKVCRRKYTFGN